MIPNWGIMNCGGKCENVKLYIGDYQLKSHLFSIDMGGYDIILGVECLCTLGSLIMYLTEIYIDFSKGGHVYTLQWILVRSLEIVNAHSMEKLLNKGHSRIICQFNSI